MDLKLFLIMAVILIGIFKEVKKASKSASTGHPSPIRPTRCLMLRKNLLCPKLELPQAFEHVPIPTPLKRNTQEAFPADTETESPVVHRRKNKKNRAQHAMPRNESPQAVHQPIAPPAEMPAAADTETAGYEEDFQIRSAEEARKAIIWGEILQRKY